MAPALRIVSKKGVVGRIKGVHRRLLPYADQSVKVEKMVYDLRKRGIIEPHIKGKKPGDKLGVTARGKLKILARGTVPRALDIDPAKKKAELAKVIPRMAEAITELIEDDIEDNAPQRILNGKEIDYRLHFKKRMENFKWQIRRRAQILQRRLERAKGKTANPRMVLHLNRLSNLQSAVDYAIRHLLP